MLVDKVDADNENLGGHAPNKKVQRGGVAAGAVMRLAVTRTSVWAAHGQPQHHLVSE